MKKICIGALLVIFTLLMLSLFIHNSQFTKKSNLTLATSNFIQIQMALVAYGRTYGIYPTTLKTLPQDLLKNIDANNIVYTASNHKYSNTETLRLFYEKHQNQYGGTIGFFDVYSDVVRFRELNAKGKTSEPIRLDSFK